MTSAYEFTQTARGLSTDEVWQLIVRFKGEPYPNQLRAADEGSIVVVFPDHSSVFVHYLKLGAPRIEARS